VAASTIAVAFEEAVAEARNIFDISRLAGIVVEHPPQFVHGSRQHSFGNRLVGPNLVEQLELRDDLPRFAAQVDEHGHDLAFKVQFPAVRDDTVAFRVNAPLAKAETVQQIAFHSHALSMLSGA
jgi:hypothetical protein